MLRDDKRLADYARARGITATLGGHAELLPVRAQSCQQPGAPIHQLLLTTKAPDSLGALRSIDSQLAKGARIVLLQNGLGVAEELRSLRPDLHCYHAVTTEGAYRPSPFQLVHAGRGHTQLGGGAQSARLARALSAPPLTVSPSHNIERALWRKLAINCAINPLTAIYRCRNGELLDNPLALQQLHTVVDEILLLGENLIGDGTLPAGIFDGLREEVLAVVKATALNRSSMYQDVLAGRRSEIDYITGYLCRQAENRGIELPQNRQLLTQVRGLVTANY